MDNFRQIDPEIYVGSQPTEQDFQALKGDGVNTLIDFRQPGETTASNRDLATGAGLDYANIPVDRSRPRPEQIDELQTLLARSQPPVLLFCGSGIRATTLYLLAKARQEGWGLQRVEEEAAKAGYSLQNAPDLRAFAAQTLGYG